jgi:uncharacterized membrane protein
MWSKLTARGVALAFLVTVVASANAWAYIDPGTGMSFISGIGAFFAALFALVVGAVAMTFKRWTAFFLSRFKKRSGGGNDSKPPR